MPNRRAGEINVQVRKFFKNIKRAGQNRIEFFWKISKLAGENFWKINNCAGGFFVVAVSYIPLACFGTS